MRPRLALRVPVSEQVDARVRMQAEIVALQGGRAEKFPQPSQIRTLEKFPGSRSLQLRLSRSSSFQCSLQRSFEKMVRVCERNSASVAFSGRTWIFSSSRAAALPCRKSEPFAQ